MKTLLKDMPEFAERIENNFECGEAIKDNLNDCELSTDFYKTFKDDLCRRLSQVLRDEVEFEIEDGKVRILNREDVVQSLYAEIKDRLEGEVLEVKNKGDIAISIRESIAEFVNQNYTFKKDEAKSYDEGYEQGQSDYEEENPPINEEKLCTEYVVEKFSECDNFEEFKSVFNELRNLSYIYM